MNDLPLISLVKHYDELYNTQNPGYSNHLRRDNIWEEIGNQLSENGMQCRERWQRIRENFRKALNLRKIKRDQGAENIKPPKYYKELNFLLPYLNEEDILEDLISAKPTSFLAVRSPHSPIDSPEGDSQLSDISMSNIITKATAGRKRRHNHNQQLVSNEPPSTSDITKQLATRTDTSSNSTQSPDPLIDFFLTMARTVKTFSLNKQLEIKRQLFQMVHNVEIDIMNEEYINRPSERSFGLVSVTTDEETGHTHAQFKLEPSEF